MDYCLGHGVEMPDYLVNGAAAMEDVELPINLEMLVDNTLQQLGVGQDSADVAARYQPQVGGQESFGGLKNPISPLPIPVELCGTQRPPAVTEMASVADDIIRQAGSNHLSRKRGKYNTYNDNIKPSRLFSIPGDRECLRWAFREAVWRATGVSYYLKESVIIYTATNLADLRTLAAKKKYYSERMLPRLYYSGSRRPAILGLMTKFQYQENVALGFPGSHCTAVLDPITNARSLYTGLRQEEHAWLRDRGLRAAWLRLHEGHQRWSLFIDYRLVSEPDTAMRISRLGLFPASDIVPEGSSVGLDYLPRETYQRSVDNANNEDEQETDQAVREIRRILQRALKISRENARSEFLLKPDEPMEMEIPSPPAQPAERKVTDSQGQLEVRITGRQDAVRAIARAQGTSVSLSLGEIRAPGGQDTQAPLPCPRENDCLHRAAPMPACTVPNCKGVPVETEDDKEPGDAVKDAIVDVESISDKSDGQEEDPAEKELEPER